MGVCDVDVKVKREANGHQLKSQTSEAAFSNSSAYADLSLEQVQMRPAGMEGM